MWEDLTLIGMKALLWYAPKEIVCPTHGRIQEEIPWVPAYSRVTYRLEWRICCPVCQSMTQKAAAEIMKMASSTLSDLLHRGPRAWPAWSKHVWRVGLGSSCGQLLISFTPERSREKTV